MSKKVKYEFIEIRQPAYVDNHNVLEVPEGYLPLGAESHWGTSSAGMKTFHFVREYIKPLSKRQIRLARKAAKEAKPGNK